MKRWTIVIISAILSLSLAGTASAAAKPQAKPQDIQVVLNGQAIDFSDVSPVNLDGKVVVPFRPLFAQLGYEVAYDNQTKTIHAKSAEHEIQMSLNGDVAFVDGKTVAIGDQLLNIDGRTVVGVRFIGELSGKRVEWLADSRTVRLTDKEPTEEQAKAILGVFDRMLELEAVNDRDGALTLFTEDSPVRPILSEELPRSKNQLTHTEFLSRNIVDFESTWAVVETEEHTVSAGGDYYFGIEASNSYYLVQNETSGQWQIYSLNTTDWHFDDPKPLLDQGVSVPEPDKSAIDALMKAQNDAYEAEDIDAFLATLVPSADNEESRATVTELFDQTDLTFTLSRTAVLSYREDYAVVVQEKIIEDPETGGKARLIQGNILLKQDGEWLFDNYEYSLLQEQL